MSRMQSSHGTTPPGSIAPTPAPRTQSAPPQQRRCLTNFLLNMKLANAIAIVGLVLAVVMMIWSIWAGILSLRYSAIQTCASLIAIDEHSAYCEKLIKERVTGKFRSPFGTPSYYKIWEPWDDSAEHENVPDIHTTLTGVFYSLCVGGCLCHFCVTRVVPWLRARYTQSKAARQGSRYKQA